MFIWVTSAAMRNPKIKVGTMCVKYSVTKTPNVASVPSNSSTVNKSNASAMYLHGARIFFCAEVMKKCAAINPTNTDKIAAASCALP